MWPCSLGSSTLCCSFLLTSSTFESSRTVAPLQLQEGIFDSLTNVACCTQGADGGEKNNERFATRRGAGAAVQDAGPPGTRNDVAASGGGDNNRDNRNISKDDGVSDAPDTDNFMAKNVQCMRSEDPSSSFSYHVKEAHVETCQIVVSHAAPRSEHCTQLLGKRHLHLAAGQHADRRAVDADQRLHQAGDVHDGRAEAVH